MLYAAGAGDFQCDDTHGIQIGVRCELTFVDTAAGFTGGGITHRAVHAQRQDAAAFVILQGRVLSPVLLCIGFDPGCFLLRSAAGRQKQYRSQKQT